MRLKSLCTIVIMLSDISAARAASRPYTVVIDAGHGGRDPGALSTVVPHGDEKSVTLAIALAVRNYLRGKHDVRVILTRSDDRYVTLAARRRIGEEKQADLFLSIHADSASDPTADGASIYTLREDGRLVVVQRMAASDRTDRSLDHETISVLNDLKQRGTMNDSAIFATTLAVNMSQVTEMRSHARQSAHFAVLKAEGVPAILLETGYVTNARDAALLFSKVGRKSIADAIANTINTTAAGR